MAAFSWKKTTIKTDNGEEKEGIAPIIISASRSTDIPAWNSSKTLGMVFTNYWK